LVNGLTRLLEWLALVITAELVEEAHLRSVLEEETHHHHRRPPEVEVEVEAVDMDQSRCQLLNAALANKDPPDPLDLPETKVLLEKMAAMVKMEATAKMEQSEKPVEDTADLLQHRVKSVHLVHPVPLVPPDPKARLAPRVRQEARLPTENEESVVKSALKDRPVGPEILVVKDPTVMQVLSILSKDPPDHQADPARTVPKVLSALLAKMESPERKALAVEREKTAMQALLANLEPVDLLAEKVPLALLEVAIIAQLLAQLQDIRKSMSKMPDQKA